MTTPGRRPTFREKLGRIWDATSLLDTAFLDTRPRLYRGIRWSVRAAVFAALAVTRPFDRSAGIERVLLQVDLLLAMNRKEDAIALLDRNLTLDRNGRLRARLVELGGHLRAI